MEGCEIRSFDIHLHVFKDEQHSCPFLFSKNGRGYTKQNLNYLEQGNRGVFVGQGDHDYCGVPPRSSAQGSKFSVQNCERFKQVEVKSANISINLAIMGKARHRTFCFTSVSAGSRLHVMETRSF